MHYVYRAYDETGRALYVGQTEDLPGRLAQHRSGSMWWVAMDQLVVTSYTSRRKATDMENALIDELRPMMQPRYTTDMHEPALASMQDDA